MTSRRAAKSPRGVALILAVIFTAVVLSIGLSLADISYKQIVLASSARQSEYAFYNADSALECVLEMDQQYPSNFALANAGNVSLPAISCEGVTPSISTSPAQSGTPGVSLSVTIQIPCPNSTGYNAQVTLDKYSTPQGSNGYYTYIYSNGFNNCTVNDPARVERGIVSHY